MSAELVTAAYAVSQFVKSNDYPEMGSEGFHTLARLLNDQEIALNQMGHYIPKDN